MQKLLRLLSDPTRVRILLAVEGEELAVNEIAEALDMHQPRISNHLRLLRDGNALHPRHEGTWTFYRNALHEDPERAALWAAVKGGLGRDATVRSDAARRRKVLERRRERSREHFGALGAGNGQGVTLEHGTLREEIVAALVPEDWVVVDAGCGDGFLTELLGERFGRVLAFDHSPERLKAARARVPADHVAFEPAEIDTLPLPDAKTDALCLSMVLHHAPEVGAALREARRVLRPGGRVAIAELAPHQEESMRERMGDLRLGMDPGAVSEALRAAGFVNVRTLSVRDRLVVGPRTALEFILVVGDAPPAPGARRRKRQDKGRNLRNGRHT